MAIASKLLSIEFLINNNIYTKPIIFRIILVIITLSIIEFFPWYKQKILENYFKYKKAITKFSAD